LRDSGGPNQDRSVTQQRDEVSQYCQKYNLVLIHPPFEDIHRSGGSTIGRSAFDQMLALSAREGLRPKGLLVWNFARFARDVDDSHFYKAILRKRGILIHSEGPFGPVIETLIHVSDEQKKHEASLGARRGLRALVRQGAMPGTPPKGFKIEAVATVSELGVKRQAHRWVPDPELIPLIRRAWELRASGLSLAEIARQTHLYKSLNCFSTFFTNKIYIGELHYGDQVIENYCEPIIDRPTWEAVQLQVQKYAARQNVHARDHQHPRRKSSSFLLSGLAICARCKSPLYGHNSPQKGGSTDFSYRCSGGRRKRDCALPRIPAFALEQAVIDGLQAALTDPLLMNEIYALANSRQDAWQVERNRRRSEILRQRTRTRSQLAHLTAAIAEAGHSRSLLEKLSALEKDLTAAETELSSLDQQVPVTPQLPELVLASLKDLKTKLASLDLHQRQAILRQFISSVRVDRHDRHLVIQMDIYYPGKDLPTPFSSSPQTVAMIRSPMGALLFSHSFEFTIHNRPHLQQT
jgi:DNA invertase Pin-like site-specific DNA recombinase